MSLKNSLAATMLLLTLSPVIARAQPVEPPTDSTGSTQTTPASLEPTVTQVNLECPPGQFASPFSDVLPTDWAYQAVLQLSGTAIECFDLPQEPSSPLQGEGAEFK